MRTTADVTGGKPIAVSSKSTSDVSANKPLVAFYDINGEKERGAILLFYDIHEIRGEVLFFCSVPVPVPVLIILLLY
jgi:hypothetical protein